ncbi:DNA polymerase alpha subunit B N-terminal-domain-containing protein [Emericellopsis atlantica]|uniref:DNA polymerase alpha subunit B n=1 Tax=Emericellopsis atlantica TaxID=2614577 RepID=A0A9P8CS67_9HYPO|nr:DNA polymerase alpha subunit B N-terminal-domain-containing protein [Emericellopsis atlantica]KAG9255436.1 DNA polymerase alpha subunit B N-terminal-domain-containing protein [Emericellopsis atlantica]
MADKMDEELSARFSPNKPLPPDILSELQSIMRLHDLSPEDIYLKWDSYCLRMDYEAQDVTLAKIRSLKHAIQDTLEKDSSRRALHSKTSATPRQPRGGDVYGILDGMVPSTPATSGKLRAPGSGLKRRAGETPRSSAPMSSPAGGMSEQLKTMNVGSGAVFSERTNAGEVVEIFGKQHDAPEPPMAPHAEARIRLKAASDQTKTGYKALAMKLSEASGILDDRIEEFQALVQEYHSLEESSFGSAASQSTTPIVAVGRIASDSLTGKLNAASLVLETSRRTGMALRIPLDMSKIRSWSFFPGQTVALKGSNTSGKAFVVEEILEIPLLPNAASVPSALEAHREKLRGGPDAMMEDESEPGPLNILFASGPYTADDNLDFEPLHTLCSQAADTYADALILTGPFLDIDHPLIATGDFDLPDEANVDPDTATMATVFRYLVSPALNRLAAANPSITIIMVPSVRDIIDKHVCWPQDTVPRRDLGLPKAAKIVSNPMALNLNEAVVGLSSQDILFELGGEEVAHNLAHERLARLCRYLVEQRHYFPLFPSMERSRLPATGTEDKTATGAALDVGYLKLGEMVNVRPDVMMTPSAFPPFARVVENVLMINPGTLSKRKGAGTYARMALFPPKVEGAELVDGMIGHRVFDRARVEIVRI